MARMPRPAPPAATPSRGALSIVSPGADFLLFWGTPLLIVPAVLLLHERWSSAQLYLFVSSFGAVGHHLPGMLRAYGDDALRRRFALRFLLAPALLLVACVGLAFHARSALVLTVFAWGAWHGALQIHGFARIYDGKAGSSSALTALLDQSLALSWFAAVIAASDTRVHYLLEHALQAGLPVPAAGALAAARTAILGLALAITIAWVARAAWQWRAGVPPSPLKLALLVTSIGFYAFANIVVSDLLLAVVLFEAFHDVQYLSIVWLYNRRRAATAEAGAFTRWLFRPRWILLALYVALCFAYGGLNWVQAKLPHDEVATALAGVLAASALLHFYYDGFIWKLRESGTREGLGLPAAATGQAAPLTPLRTGPMAHGLKWAVLFVLPLGVLAIASPRALAEGERALALAAALPEDAGAQRNRAVALERAGDAEGALAAARRACALAPRADEATRREVARTLGSLLASQIVRDVKAGRLEPATALAREAVAAEPSSADTLSDAAASLIDAGDARGAELLCRAVLGASPDHAALRTNLAVALAGQGRLPEAHLHALRATQLLPGDPRPRAILDGILAGIEAQARSPAR